jgi:hypothetical protein
MTVAALSLCMVSAGCSTYSLSDQSGVLPLAKHRRANDGKLAVALFEYVPDDPDDADKVTDGDLLALQRVLLNGFDQTDIFSSVVAADGTETLGAVDSQGDYVLDGRITNFRFEKNWVPTFFPVHVGMSFITLTGYTIFGGPTTATIVRMSVDFELRDGATGETVALFTERYTSTRAVNIYSKGAENPYENPNMVLAQIIDSAAKRMAVAIP